MQSDARMVENLSAHGFSQRFQILRSCDAVIDEEIAMLLRNLRVSNPKPATTGGINQLPRFLSVRVCAIGVFERAAAGARFNLAGCLRACGISSISAIICPLSPLTALKRADI